MADPTKSWTTDEEGLLDRYVIGELSVQAISEMTGRSPLAVRARAHKLGKRRGSGWVRNFPPELKTKLGDMYLSGLTITEMEPVVGLSYHVIRSVITDLGITVDQSKAGRKASQGQVRVFTPTEQATIREMWDAKASVQSIAETVGCDRHTLMKFINGRMDTRSLVGSRQQRATSVQADTIVREFTVGMLTRDNVASLAGCKRTLVERVLRDAKVDINMWTGRKLSAIISAEYRSGKRSVSPLAGHGIRTQADTPFQGSVLMRSRTEAQRAQELDATGMAWFYEIQRYPLSDGRTYTPDFWVTQVPVGEAQSVLGVSPTRAEIRKYLSAVSHTVEDVKGWFNENHPSYAKIAAFRKEHTVDFHVRVMRKGVATCL